MHLVKIGFFYAHDGLNTVFVPEGSECEIRPELVEGLVRDGYIEGEDGFVEPVEPEAEMVPMVPVEPVVEPVTEPEPTPAPVEPDPAPAADHDDDPFAVK